MKKILKFLNVNFIILFFASCGSAENNQNNTNEVTIGILAPLTGSVAHFGVSVYEGLRLFIDEYNARGGLQISYVIFDEQGTPTEAVVGYNWLMDQNVAAILGSVTSGATLAVAPFANEDNMPMISATSTHRNVTINTATEEPWGNVFRASFIDPFQGEKMAEFAREIIGANTAAILFNSETDYSIGLRDAFSQRATELGITIVAEESFGNDTVDFLGQLTNIATTNPDVFFIPAYHQDIALIGPQSALAGINTVMLGADGWDGALSYIGDPSPIEGAFFLSGFYAQSTTPIVQDFVANYQLRFETVPNMFAAQAYDAAKILIYAIEQAVNDGYSPSNNNFRNAVIANMANTDIDAVTGHIVFDNYNNPQKTAFIIQIVNGEEVFWGNF
ncbi:MAG: ABC transporter substrate-binding protein [Defluviitaleaceae bacterium]|nr:ABC transporter substrate-binding protein [Defluviitaleaceae bacterium]